MEDMISIKPRPVFFFDIDNCVSGYVRLVICLSLISVPALSSQYVKK